MSILVPDTLYIDAGDEKVSILTTLEDPYIVVFGGFLNDLECDALIEAAKPRLTRSLTKNNDTGGNQVHESRTSNGMFFAIGENDTVTRIEKRIASILNWPVDHGEGLQIAQYIKGAEYKPHYDYFDPSQVLDRGGQRIGTLIMYLSEPEEGGRTIFPDVNFAVSPKRGNAVFFGYIPHPSSKTLHAGEPVLSGEKWIATKWFREGKFY